MAQVSHKGVLSTTPDWLVLQKRIFHRWCQNNLAKKHLKLDDIVKGWGTGEQLIGLIEVLSEKTFTGKKLTIPCKMRVQNIDNCQRALQFAEQCGVQMELKTSAENLVDGEEKQVLGLVWGIMRSMMKFGNEDEKMKAQDALLMWVRNQTQGYKNVNIRDFNTSFKDGIALCSLLHKFRPKLVPNIDSLDPKNFDANLRLAFKAANEYFGLDEYLTPQEIQKLDDKSMYVYVSEYYAGIAAERRKDIAARRIAKLIASNKYIAQLKTEYVEKAQRLVENLKKATQVLLDNNVDTTLEAAQKRLDDFYEYQTKQKGLITSDYLSIETLYNQLAMKLADSKRPAWVPPEGYDLKGLSTAFSPLEAAEAEKSNTLRERVNRLKELLLLEGQHKAKYDKLKQWIEKASKQLAEPLRVESSGVAEYQQNRLAAFKSDLTSTKNGTLSEMQAIGKQLLDLKFEHSDQVVARESEIKSTLDQIEAKVVELSNLLADLLVREQLRERIELLDKQHEVSTATLGKWISEESEKLERKAESESSRDARVHLDKLAQYARARSDIQAQIDAFYKLGAEITSAEHKSKFEGQSWVFPSAQVIKEREAKVEAGLKSLESAYQSKKAILDDTLKCLLYKEKTELLAKQHGHQAEAIGRFVAAKKAYLEAKENVGSVKDARAALNLLEVFHKNKKDMLDGDVAALHKLGVSLLESKYAGPHAQWSLANGEEIKTREAAVGAQFEQLEKLAGEKLDILKDDFAREDLRERISAFDAQHAEATAQLQAWAAPRLQYLEAKEDISNVQQAQVALSALDSFNNAFQEQTATGLAALNKLAKDISEAKHAGRSQWAFDKKAELDARTAAVEQTWKNLKTASALKSEVLQDALAREQFKAKLAVQEQQHISSSQGLESWINEKKTYLATKENVQDVKAARLQLNLLAVYAKTKAEMSESNLPALKKLGSEICAAKYESKHSTAAFEKAEELKAREAKIEGEWANLDKLHAEKLAVLQDDLAREEFREKAELKFQEHTDNFTVIMKWVDDSVAHLQVFEPVASVRDADLFLNQLDVFNKDKANMIEGSIAALNRLANELKTEKYQKLSAYALPQPQVEELGKREEAVRSKLEQIAGLQQTKLAKHTDNRAREEYKDQVQSMQEQHAVAFAGIQAWIKDKTAALNKEAKIGNVQDARVQLNLLSVFEKDKTTLINADVAAFDKLSAEILASKYQEQWALAEKDANDIKQRQAEVKTAVESVSVLAATKTEQANQSLQSETTKEANRVSFASLAAETTRWAKDTLETVRVKNFGFSLKAVEAYKVKITEHDQEIKNQAAKLQSQYGQVFEEGKKIGVAENPYTQSTVAELDALVGEVHTAQEQRLKDYELELQQQRENDALCKQFADVAAPFVKALQSAKDVVSASQAPLEDQIKEIEERLKNKDAKEGASLPQIGKLYEELAQKKVQSNPYTLLTAKDCEVQFAQYQDFLVRKMKQMEDELHTKKLRGISPQQMAEIDRQFKEFDKDNGGTLDYSEFKSCLYSLGHDMASSDVKKTMMKYGADEKNLSIKYEGFRAFMVSLYGDNDSKEEIVNAFKEINKNKPSIDKQGLELLSDADIEYFMEHAPKNPDGTYNYDGFVQKMFSQ